MGMRPAVFVSLVLAGGALVAPATAGAARSVGSREVRPFFDSREGAAAAATPRSSRGRAALRSSLGRSGVLKIDPLTNTPRSLMKLKGALTAPAAGSRDAIARSYLRGNASALGLSAADVDSLTLAERENAPGGLTLLRYRQAYQGIPAFDNGVRVAIDRGGRVLSLNGSPRHAISVASVTPRISATDALRALQSSVGLTRGVRVKSGPSGARRTTAFASGEQARLTLFGAAGGPRLAWRVDYKATSREHYDGVVDATSGRLLWRANRVKSFTGNVFDYYLGAPDGGTLRDQDLTTPGWLPSTATNLTGPNAHTWSDINDDNVAQPTEEVTPESGDFNFAFTPFTVNGAPRCLPNHICGWDPVGDRSSWETNRKQSATQAFFLVNKFHDHLAAAPIGFDSASGSFQGDDPLLNQSFDGANTGGDGGPDSDHVDNANMDTPPDGQSPTMQLYLFEYLDGLPQFDYLGDDAATVWHEYTHGLSNRLVVDGDGVGALNSAHSGAMGEAWSDWYAEDLLTREGLETDNPDVSGDIDLGEPSDPEPHITRTEAIDCPVGSGSSDPDTACPGGANTGPGGYTLGDFAKIVGGPEVHADGEIWVQTLWDLRQNLVDAFGSEADGSDAAELLITNGMRLSPPEPSMLEARNAILEADTANGGDLHDIIWAAFAHRGMGYYASAFDGNDTHPAEDFNTPPAADAPQGTLAGRVFDSQTGLPLAGARVRLGGATDAGGNATLVDTTGADGRYQLDGVTEGTYGKLAVRSGSGGYDPVDVAKVVIRGGETTTKDVPLDRNWISLPGGARTVSSNDDTFDALGCGPDALIDDADDGSGWVANNPSSPDYPDDLSGDLPVSTFSLPKSVDLSAIAIDPAPGCFFLGASAGLRDYKLEVSSDGTTFRTLKEGSFTQDQAGTLVRLEPTGTVGKDVKQIRLTMKQSFVQDEGFTGRDYISASRLEVFGAVPNALPSGSLTATPATAAPGQAVTLDASSFKDPDSLITGYDWDFDGNGSVDRSTTAPTTSFAYASTGTFTPKVAAKDFRGGTGTASTSVTVATKPPTTPTAPPKLTLAKSGKKGSYTLRVKCAEQCKLSGKLTVSRKVARALGRKKLTLRTVNRTITTTASKTYRVKLSKSVLKALKRHHLKSVLVKARFTATYADGRKKTASRRVRIRR
jgi:extracellular elastinolytic metalloproteinase